MIIMKLSEFIRECNNFEYSKEYFELYKEASEIELMEVWLECQDASLYNREEKIYNESYFLEADNSKKEDIQNRIGKKKENFFKRIWKNIVGLFKRFWNWIKKFFTRNTVKHDIENAQEAIAKLAKNMKKEEKISDREVEIKINRIVGNVLNKLNKSDKKLINGLTSNKKKGNRSNIFESSSQSVDWSEYNKKDLDRRKKYIGQNNNIPNWLKDILINKTCIVPTNHDIDYPDTLLIYTRDIPPGSYNVDYIYPVITLMTGEWWKKRSEESFFYSIMTDILRYADPNRKELGPYYRKENETIVIPITEDINTENFDNFLRKMEDDMNKAKEHLNKEDWFLKEFGINSPQEALKKMNMVISNTMKFYTVIFRLLSKVFKELKLIANLNSSQYNANIKKIKPVI